MSLPGNFHDEAYSHAGILVGAAERINDEQSLARQFLDGQFLQLFPVLLGQFVVVVRIFRCIPPYGILGILVHDNVLVLRGTSCVDTCHDVDSTQFRQLTLFIAGQFGLHFLFEKKLVGRIVDDFLCSGNSVLC